MIKVTFQKNDEGKFSPLIEGKHSIPISISEKS